MMGAAPKPNSFSDVCLQAVSSLVDIALGHQGKPTNNHKQPEPMLPDEPGKWESIMGGRYQLDVSGDGFLGQGTSCTCQKGRDARTGTLVAIKTYKAEPRSVFFGSDDATFKKFSRSISVLKKLQEPFERPADVSLWASQLEYVEPSQLFMRLLDYSQDAKGMPCCDAKDGKLYVVTELAQQSLKDFVSKKKIANASPSKETVRSMSRAIVMVMAGLHAKGLVHMDVKPENLMVFDGCLKLIDVDGCVEIGSKVYLNDPSISFSPIYCAPEWANFLLDKNRKACIDATPGLDAWSVGCTLCELVTLESVLRPDYNRLTRRDQRRGLVKYMDWLGTLQEVSIPDAVNELDDELGAVVTSLLACNMTKRSSCAAMLSSPCLATDKVKRTKSSPLTCEAYGFSPDSDTDSTCGSDGGAACSSRSSHMSQ